MKLLDSYILRQFLSTFVFVVILLLAVITVIDLTENMDKYAKFNVPTGELVAYYFNFIAWIGGLVAPITVFISVVYVCARMAGHTEIIAMLSSGMSFRRIMLPYFYGALILASISFVLNGWVIPNSNKSRLEFIMQYLKKDTNRSLRNVHLQIAPNTFIYLQSYNSSNDKGYHFTLELFEDKHLVQKLTADRIEWDTLKQTWTLREWKLKKVDAIFSDSSQTEKLIESGTTMDTTLAIHPKEFKSDYRKYDGLTLPELDHYIATLKLRGAAGIQVYEVEKYFRYASPFTIFILTFLAVVVSSHKSRQGTGYKIAIGFALSFVFILFFMLIRTFAEAGSIPPQLTAWIPIVVFGTITAILYRNVPR